VEDEALLLWIEVPNERILISNIQLWHVRFSHDILQTKYASRSFGEAAGRSNKPEGGGSIH
jgi:hypothetical protein